MYSDTSPFSIPWNEERLECGRALCLQGCTHTLFTSQRCDNGTKNITTQYRHRIASHYGVKQ
jgi:hypothetical protein